MKNNYVMIQDLLFDLKETLYNKGSLDKELEMRFMIINKEIDRMRNESHETKQRINELLSRL